MSGLTWPSPLGTNEKGAGFVLVDSSLVYGIGLAVVYSFVDQWC